MPLALVRSVRCAVMSALTGSLLVAFVVIARLADATLPDPVWISSIHDGDYDEVWGVKVVRRLVQSGPAVPRAALPRDRRVAVLAARRDWVSRHFPPESGVRTHGGHGRRSRRPTLPPSGLWAEIVLGPAPAGPALCRRGAAR